MDLYFEKLIIRTWFNTDQNNISFSRTFLFYPLPLLSSKSDKIRVHPEWVLNTTKNPVDLDGYWEVKLTHSAEETSEFHRLFPKPGFSWV